MFTATLKDITFSAVLTRASRTLDAKRLGALGADAWAGQLSPFTAEQFHCL